MNTIQLNDDFLSIQVLNTQNSVYLKGELYFLKDNSMRFKLNELNPLKKRYEVEDALVGEPKITK